MRSRDAVPQREGACRSGSTPGLVPRGQQGQGCTSHGRPGHGDARAGPPPWAGRGLAKTPA